MHTRGLDDADDNGQNDGPFKAGTWVKHPVKEHEESIAQADDEHVVREDVDGGNFSDEPGGSPNKRFAFGQNSFLVALFASMPVVAEKRLYWLCYENIYALFEYMAPDWTGDEKVS